MAARDGASSVQGQLIRITPLNEDGSIDTNKPVLTTKGFISASFSPEYEDGDEISEKNASGGVCVSWKAPDTLKRLSFSLSLCSPDPEAAALLAGGKVICDGTEIIGYTSPVVGGTADNPVAIEIWSIANIGGKPAAGTPYWHWAFPYVKIRYDGSREFSNSALSNEFSGQALGNGALVGQGLNPLNLADDFVKYREALINPFSYVRTASYPKPVSGSTEWSGQLVPDGTNSINCSGIAPITATSAVAGDPGHFEPTGAAVPFDLAALNALAINTGTAAWTTDQHILLGDTSQAYWDGDGNGWVAGVAT